MPLAPIAPLLALTVPAPKVTRAYFVGNSVTDTLDYRAFAALFASRGRALVWGRHVIPGTPLFLPWKGAEEGRTDGFVEPPFGNAVQALKGYAWDALTLQPFDRHERDLAPSPGGAAPYDEGDVASALRYVAPAATRNPDVRVFVYARWPRMSVAGKGVAYDRLAYLDRARTPAPLPAGLDPWSSLWTRPYTGGWDGTNESRAYFERLTSLLRRERTGLRRPVAMIPVGHAMALLDARLRAGAVPGRPADPNGVWSLYDDGIHLGRAGSYLVGCAFYAALTGESPRRLPAAPYGIPDDGLAREIRIAAAEAARANPYP